MDFPVVKLLARKQSELHGNSVAIDCYQMSDILHLELPTWAKPFEIVDIFEIGSKVETQDNILEKTKRLPHSIWVDIPQDALNLDPGYHKYRVRLTNDEIVVTLYFDYTFICCHPEKPYVYMDHKGECACG